MSIPFGTYTKAMRTGGFLAVFANASAGTMESRKGSATAVPTPLKKVLRSSALRVMIIAFSPLGLVSRAFVGQVGNLRRIGNPPAFSCRHFFRPARLERKTLHDFVNQRLKAIFGCCQLL